MVLAGRQPTECHKATNFIALNLLLESMTRVRVAECSFAVYAMIGGWYRLALAYLGTRVRRVMVVIGHVRRQLGKDRHGFVVCSQKRIQFSADRIMHVAYNVLKAID